MVIKRIDELKPFDDALVRKFNALAQGKIEYWDLRIELHQGTHLEFTNQKSKEISSYEILEGSIRTFVNGGWGFNVIKDFSMDSLTRDFEKTIKLAKLSESLSVNKFKMAERDPFKKDFEIVAKQPLSDIDIVEKVELIKDHEHKASIYSPKVKNTWTYYSDSEEYKIFQNCHGSDVYQHLSFLRLYNSVYAQQNGTIQRAGNSIGGQGGFEILKTENALTLSERSAQQAVDLLEAKSPPGGKFDVIMDPKLTGTLIHEAFGHACEADIVLSEQSVLKGRLGEKVVDEKVSIIDDPTMGKGKLFNVPYELYGSYFVDDEGVPSQKTYLIKEGILNSYLHGLETSSRMSVSPNGHGRAASTSDRPIVRMGITLLEQGEWSLEEMIEETKNGIYCQDYQYGYTDPTTGQFQFKCKLSNRITNGECGEIMRDVSLSGLILEILNKIGGIGKKSEMDFSDGTCGKQGQGVRVCDGGPNILIKDVMVGGMM